MEMKEVGTPCSIKTLKWGIGTTPIKEKAGPPGPTFVISYSYYFFCQLRSIISTRLFCAIPSAVSFEAIGR